MSETILVEIRCPHQSYIPKFKKQLTCHNLIVRVEPGAKGQGFCWLKDSNTNIRHGEFYFDIDPDYRPAPKNIIKVKRP